MQTLKSFLRIILLLFAVSCGDSFELPPEANENIATTSGFSIPAAQEYFETNAHDLASLRFADSLPPTRTIFRSSAELIPEWKKAIRSNHPKVCLVEVPIASNMITLSTERIFKKGKITVLAREGVGVVKQIHQ